MLKNPSPMLIFLLLLGCSGPAPQPAPSTKMDSTSPNTTNWQLTADVAAANSDGTSIDSDLGAVPADSTASLTDTVTAGDSSAPGGDAAQPGSDVPRWQPPETDASPLTVLSTTPTIGALGVARKFVFTLTFSSPVVDAGIQPYTVLVQDPLGQPIDGDFKVDGASVTFTATKAAPPWTRIDVTVTTIVRGVQGQTMQGPFAYHFHTTGHDNMKPWALLAARYAPVIRLAVTSKSSDWPAKQRLAFDLSDPASSVGWSVAATRSHYFITYVFQRPERISDAGKVAFAPDTSGATVIVRRWPQEIPAGLFTWFADGSDEQWWGWLTKEGGLLPPGASAKKANVRKVVAVQTLFPASSDTVGVPKGVKITPRRYLGLVTAKRSQSCWWPDLGDTQHQQCQTHASAKSAMNLVVAVPHSMTDKPPWSPTPPSGKLPVVPYQLRSMDASLWPRRADSTLFDTPLTFTYQPPSGRPAGMQAPMGSKYNVGKGGFSRPPWAWRWKPATNVSYYALPRGAIFMDPAWSVYQRLGGNNAKIASWNPTTKTGYSNDYCFAPRLFIDKRKAPECVGVTPAG